MMALIVFIVLFINIDWSIEAVHGFTCSNVQPLTNFQPENIIGTWFLMARDPTKYDIKYKCARSNLTFEMQTTLHYAVSAIRTDDNTEFFYNVIMDFNGDTSIANFTTHVPEKDPEFRFNVLLVAADFQSYQVYYSCDEKVEIEYCWVLARSRIIKNELWEKIISIVDKYKLNKRHLVEVRNTDCYN